VGQNREGFHSHPGRGRAALKATRSHPQSFRGSNFSAPAVPLTSGALSQREPQSSPHFLHSGVPLGARGLARAHARCWVEYSVVLWIQGIQNYIDLAYGKDVPSGRPRWKIGRD
jgi:hypothetical protein